MIVGYRVQYWELGRRDTAEEVNTTAEVFSYSNFSKCSAAYTILTVEYNSNVTLSMNRCRRASQSASSSCHYSRSWGEQRG